jgi:hypothetical protein
MRRCAGLVVAVVLLGGCSALRPEVTDMTSGRKAPASPEIKQWSVQASTALSVMRGFFDQFVMVVRYNNDPAVYQKTCQTVVERISLLRQAAPQPAPDAKLDGAYRQTLDGFERYISECVAADDHAAEAAFNDYDAGTEAVFERVSQLSA